MKLVQILINAARGAFCRLQIIIFAVVAILKTVAGQLKINPRRDKYRRRAARWSRRERTGSASVEQAMRRVERQRKQAPFVPFERFSCAYDHPTTHRALAIENTK
jgi:hypothetical protein